MRVILGALRVVAFVIGALVGVVGLVFLWISGLVTE